MSTSDRTTRRAGRRTRVLATIAVLALLAPLGFAVSRLWATIGESADFVNHERDGVAYLRPLVKLVADTTDAQSAAVSGGQGDLARLRDAQAVVDAVDKRLGSELGTSHRWVDVSARIDAIASNPAPPTAAAAYASYSQLVDLELALVSTVGDSSNLILDPQLDSYYVMDATLTRVPSLIVTSGRVSDQATLNDADPVTVEVTRAQAGDAAAALDDGLRKAFASTQSRTLGPGLLASVDRLRGAVSALAPSTADVGAATPTRSVQTERAARVQVRDAALTLESAGLDQLDLLLAVRQDDARTQRTWVVAATAAGLLVALLAWWATGARPRRPRAPGTDPLDYPDRDPADARPSRTGRDDVDQGPLAEARRMLDGQHLAGVGHADDLRRERA